MVDCLKCSNSACCKLVVYVDKSDYERFEILGLSKYFLKETDKFIAKHPEKADKFDVLEKLNEHDYAELLKSDSGYCQFLGDDMLCSIYESRPSVCKTYSNDRCESIRCLN